MAILIIFPVILQTVINLRMLFIKGQQVKKMWRKTLQENLQWVCI